MKKKWAVFFWVIFFLGVFCTPGFSQAQNGSIRSVNVQTLKSWLTKSEKVTLIDAGSLLACMDAKIPGSYCLPCDQEKDASLFSSLPKENKMVFYAAYQPLDPECGLIRQALSSGHQTVFVLEGGLAAWRKAGHPVVSEKRIPRVVLPSIKPARLSEWQKNAKNPLVIDIRLSKAYAQNHLDGAMNIPLSRLHLRYADIPMDRPLLLVDEDGSAAFLAASYLARKGFPNVQRLQGGMAAYRRGTR